MFDLTNELRTWRARLEATGSMGAAAIDELEQHLRDSLAEIQQLGLPEEESFLLATHRIGGPDALASEFEKLPGRRVWSSRVWWMTAGVLCFLFVQASAHTLRLFGWSGAAWLGYDGAVMGWWGVGAELTVWLLAAVMLAASLRRGAPLFPTGLSVKRGVAAVAGLLLSLVALRQAAMVALLRFIPVEHFGQASQATTWTNLVVGAGVPLTCVALLLWLRPAQRAAAAKA